MKKFLITTIVSIAFTVVVNAQGVRLNLYGGYVFDDRVDSYYSTTSYFNGVVKGGFLGGLGIEYLANKDYGLELMYLNQKATVPTSYYNGGLKNKDFNTSFNHILVGGNRYVHTTNNKVEPYGGLMLGLSIINITNQDPGGPASTTKFAFGFRGGIHIWASDRVGIQLQTQLISIAQAFGGGFYFGTGGAGIGATSYSSFFQFGLGGGLTFKLGQSAHH